MTTNATVDRPPMRVPASTYRLQVHAGFDLFAVADVADYVHALGADWLYLSPLLAAAPGSEHGYDVVDHSRIDPARGGPAGLDAAAKAARERDMGLLVDIVPNHVGVASPLDNPWWRDVLTHGPASRYAEAFDIDWPAGDGKVLIPVLDGDDPELAVVDGTLRYHDHRYPLAPGSASDGAPPGEVHTRQHYELIDWRRGAAELNYRRFFAVSELAAIRVEIPWVFEASHAEIVRWVRDGLVDGLRVDHPDGLADPGGYLDALRDATGGIYVLVEKILHGDEMLPPSWATAGTTGYDALADIDRVLVDPAGRAALNALDTRLRGTPLPPWPQLIHDTKREIVDGILRAEVLRLEREVRAGSEGAGEVAPLGGTEPTPIADALAELLACFPVYRSYLPFGIEHLQTAVAAARLQRPDLATQLDALADVLADPSHPAAIRFQQTSGMVMAKGVEDTAFYRYGRLGSLTEVGADPAEFSIDIDEFHRRQALRQAHLPLSLTTLSTHDTKRGEDVRARLDVLAEIPDEWECALIELRTAAPVGDGPLERLLWEAIVGAWPASRERLHAYAEKAAREAGSSTSWTAPSPDFEQRLHDLVDLAFDDAGVVQTLTGLLDVVVGPGWSNSLSAKLIQLTAPGVPDVYQGSELWELSLVDPDNRRPVDFALRRRLLAELDAGVLPPVDDTGAAKLLVTSRALRLRRERPEWFSRYVPLPAFGPAARHAVAFDRGDVVTLATRLPLGLARTGGWQDTIVQLAERPVVDLITGRPWPGGTLAVRELLDRYPVALLAPTDGEQS